MAVFQYDPKAYSLIVGGNIITGFADDDFIEIERDEDAFTKKTGVDGITTRAKNNNRSGHVIIRIMQSSSSNDALTALALADEASMGGAVAVLCKDGSGRSAFSSVSGWVKKFPKTAWKKDVNFWEWTIDCVALNIFVGGE